MVQKNGRKIFKKLVIKGTIAIVLTHEVKNDERKKIMLFALLFLRSQISAILFQEGCAINQFRKFLPFRVLLRTELLEARRFSILKVKTNTFEL